MCCFFWVYLVIASAARIFWHFNLENHHLHFAFSLRTAVGLFSSWFWGFQILHTCTIICMFVQRVPKGNFYLHVTTLTSKNITSTFFFVCFSVNMSVIPFSGIFPWKCIKHSYLVAVYTRNFFVYNRWRCNIYLWCCLLALKTSIVLKMSIVNSFKLFLNFVLK